MSNEGKIQIQADIIPNNDNPRMFATDVQYVRGAPQVFSEIDELIAFHPHRMRAGMPATILNYPKAGVITDFRLIGDPIAMLDATGESIVNDNNFSQFWQVQATTETSKVRVYQYAADGPGGGSPVYPYTPEQEDEWFNTFDASKGHRWMRFRDDDADDNNDGVYDNWTVPISVNSMYATGDFIENRFKRQTVSATVHSSSATLQADKYYLIESGQVRIQGDLALSDIGAFGTITDTTLGTGRTFKYAAANVHTFLNAGTVVETVAPPPRTVAGLPNNEPIGWSDIIPAGEEQLWQITGQKSVYGQLKSEWNIKKIIENPDYIRYSMKAAPHPDELAGVNTAATAGSPGDLALTADGWVSVYDKHDFIATRQPGTGGDLYTSWLVEKINEESGEYTDRVFKLFDINLDADSPFLVPPTVRYPASEGWSDTPQVETDTQINYVSEARKFFNGELKTAWSQPVPYTGQDTFSDVIESDLGDAFKYDKNGVVAPTEIILKALLYKGLSELWRNPDVTITYVWKKVYNNGAIVDESPSTNTADDFYLLGEASVPSNPLYSRENQRVVIKPPAVIGDAVFRCTQTILLPEGDDIIFEDEFSILDVTDGKDAKALALTADADRTIYDDVNLVFVPATIIMRAYSSNIPSPTYYWYIWNGSAWAAITNGVGGYTIAGNTLSVAAATIFAADGTAQEKRYAVSTHSINPESADYDETFSDYITISKLSAAGVGTAGEDSVLGLLSNEAHVVVLNSATGVPVAGEIGSTGKAKTLLQVYEGLVKLVYGVANDYTIALESDDAGVTFASAANGDDVDIYVDTWAANERSATCKITITYGAVIFSKNFSVSSTKDAPGAILIDIDSDKGFTFTPSDKTNKTLTAKVIDTALSGTQEIPLPDAAYTFRWNVAGVWSSTSTSNTRTITRSNILVTDKVTVEVYKNAVLFRSRTINIADVNDGKAYRAWTNSVTKPTTSQDLSNQDPTNTGIWPITVSGVVWRLPTDAFWNTNNPTYAQDAEDNGGVYTWSAVYQLKGEKGDQGGAGGFYHPMYKAADPGPPTLGASGSNSSLAEMLAAGWTSRPPSTGVIWRTERMWTGGATFNGAGDPNTAPVSGSAWTNPTRLSGKDGTNGTNGVGTNGWSPNLAVVSGQSAGVKVMQLVGWSGGSGSTPGMVGRYLGATGFVQDINLAQPVTGDPVQLQVSGSWVQWKYQSEGSASWRNLYQKEFTGWVKRTVGGSGAFVTGTNGAWVYLDTGDSSSKDLSIIAFVDVSGDTYYQFSLESNNSASYSGGTLLAQRNFKSHSSGITVTQYQIMFNGTVSGRYIILKTGTLSGYPAGSLGYFGITAIKE